MRQSGFTVCELLDKLEEFYGRQEPCWPVEPYEFIIWWQCGYPPCDTACAKGWDKLRNEVGIAPRNLLAATPAKLASALKPGGMAPELRALRLKEIAARVKDQLGGDLRAALSGPRSEARKTLKKFPGISDPGADRILLFAGIASLAAVPSNCTQVVVPLLHSNVLHSPASPADPPYIKPASRTSSVVYIIAILLGLFSGWVNQKVDDALLTALCVLAFAMMLGAWKSQRPWRWVLLVWVGVPLVLAYYQFVVKWPHDRGQVYGAFLQILAASAGGFGGHFMRQMIDHVFLKQGD